MSLTLKGVAEARHEPSDCTHEQGSRANDHAWRVSCLRRLRAKYGRGSLLTFGRGIHLRLTPLRV